VAAKYELEVLDVNVQVPLQGLYVIEQVIKEGAEESLVAQSDILLVEDVDDAVLVEIALQSPHDETSVAHRSHRDVVAERFGQACLCTEVVQQHDQSVIDRRPDAQVRVRPDDKVGQSARARGPRLGPAGGAPEAHLVL